MLSLPHISANIYLPTPPSLHLLGSVLTSTSAIPNLSTVHLFTLPSLYSLLFATVLNNFLLGDAEAEIRKAFRVARQASPCVLFLDELDALVTNRSSPLLLWRLHHLCLHLDATYYLFFFLLSAYISSLLPFPLFIANLSCSTFIRMLLLINLKGRRHRVGCECGGQGVGYPLDRDGWHQQRWWARARKRRKQCDRHGCDE